MPDITEEELAAFKAAQQRATDLEASKKRLEEENGKYKTRAKEAEGKLSDAEKAKLAAEGDTQALLDKERAEKVVLQDRIKASDKVALENTLRLEVGKFAKDAYSLDSVLGVKAHKGLLKFNEEAGTVEGAEEFVKAVKESDSYLFNPKSMKGGPKQPPSDGGNENKTDKEKYLAEIKECTDRNKLGEIRKKYGIRVD